MGLAQLRSLALVVMLGLSTGAGAVEIALVPVGDAGNPADIRHDVRGYGAVAYTFQIGRFEVTNGQYRAFLNAKAAAGDPHGLYNLNMTTSHGGIERTGSGTAAEPWAYIPKGNDPAWDSMPVNYVGAWDAARFVNWLHNGQGDGDTESGAYVGIGDLSLFARQPGARFFLPTENEWYKAAYYDPGKNDDEPGYWEFPTRSDIKPTNAAPPGDDLSAGSANYSYPVLTPVGAYLAKPSTSFYGTFDQGGNVWEWNETILTDPGVEGYFGVRGGSFDNSYGLEAEHRYSYPATLERRIMGFRVAAPVPEPSSLSLLAVAALWGMRRVKAE